MRRVAALLSVAAITALTAACSAQADEPPRLVLGGATATDAPADGAQTAVFSGGCFWGMQGVFEHVKGVQKVVAGYAGGAANTAQYDTVSEGNTGHAESVQVTFDPKAVSFAELLRVYFSVATDPTEFNRQGPDSGTQYRGEIWYTTPDQKRVAESYIAQMTDAHTFSAPIVTRVDAYKGFYPAEEYHQDYLIKNPDDGYIVDNDLPKIANLKRLLPDDYVVAPVRVSDYTPVKVE